MPDKPSWFYSLLRRLVRTKQPKVKPTMTVGPGPALKSVLEADRQLVRDSQRAAQVDRGIRGNRANLTVCDGSPIHSPVYGGNWRYFDDEQERKRNDDTHVPSASATCASSVMEDRSESVSVRHSCDTSSSSDYSSSDSGSSSSYSSD